MIGQRDVVVLPVDRQRDPQGTAIRACLQSHDAYQRWRDLREHMASVTLGLGVLVWIEAAWPRVLPRMLHQLLLIVWASLFAIMLGMHLRERYWREQLDQRVRSFDRQERSITYEQ